MAYITTTTDTIPITLPINSNVQGTMESQTENSPSERATVPTTRNSPRTIPPPPYIPLTPYPLARLLGERPLFVPQRPLPSNRREAQERITATLEQYLNSGTESRISREFQPPSYAEAISLYPYTTGIQRHGTIRNLFSCASKQPDANGDIRFLTSPKRINKINTLIQRIQKHEIRARELHEEKIDWYRKKSPY